MALNSTSTIKIIDALGEGPIEGLVHGEHSIYLNETPIKTNNVRNFGTDEVNFDVRLGGRTQTELPQSGGYSSILTDVNTEIGENYSETLDADNKVTSRSYGAGIEIRQVTDLETEQIELLFTIPSLYSTAQEGLAKGQLFYANIRIQVDIQSQGSAYNNVYDRTVRGVSTSNYQVKTPKIDLDGTGPWNIRVRKVDLGESSFEIQYANFQDVDKDISLAGGRANRLVWASLFEVKRQRLAYGYTALTGVTLSTKAFNSIPTRAYEVKGRLIEVPHNAVAREDGSLTFPTSFNGTSRLMWTTCPVCAWRDLVVNKRYGAGDYVESSNLSWVDLYPLIQYANQLVSNPDGTSEARFAINTVIGTQADAYSAIRDLASIFRGFMYWYSDIIQVNGDHGELDGTETSPVHLYSNSNVSGGVFNYSTSSVKSKSTSIKVSYNDPDRLYKPNFVVVEDPVLISKYGYQHRDIVAFGCTSKWQAQRLGRWMLNTEKLNGELVSFTAGLDGAVVMPGQVIAIADELRAGQRLSGRISSASSTAVTADQTITLPSGTNPRLSVILPDGTYQSRSIDSVSGSVITVSSAYTLTPAAQSIWSISSDSVNEQKYRVLEIQEKDDGSYVLTASIFNDSIYETVDESEELEFLDITTFDEAPTAPINLSITSNSVRINNNTVNRTVASWQKGVAGFVRMYEIRWKIGDGNYNELTTTSPSHSIDSLEAGAVLTFQVRAIGSAPVDRASQWTSETYTIPSVATDVNETAITSVPVDPTNVQITPNGSDQVLLSWQIPSTGANTDTWQAIIRHSSRTDGSGTWVNSNRIGTSSARNLSTILPLLNGEYLVKFEDENRLRSANATSAVIDIPDAIPRLNLSVVREDQTSPVFQGEKFQCFYSDEYDGLVLSGDSLIDDEADNIDDWSEIDFLGTLLQSGNYIFKDLVDLAGIFTVQFHRHLESRGLLPNELIDDRETNMDRWTDFDGTLPDDTTSELYFRKSNAGVIDSEILTEDSDHILLEDGEKIDQELDVTFGPWQVLRTGRYTGRLFQFKAELTADVADQTPIVDELGYTMQLERRTAESSTIASGAGAKAVTYTKAFYQTPSVGITALNLNSGDYYELSSESRTGFTIHFKNSSNASIDRNFRYQSVGYGAEETS